LIDVLIEGRVVACKEAGQVSSRLGRHTPTPERGVVVCKEAGQVSSRLGRHTPTPPNFVHVVHQEHAPPCGAHPPLLVLDMRRGVVGERGHAAEQHGGVADVAERGPAAAANKRGRAGAVRHGHGVDSRAEDGAHDRPCEALAEECVSWCGGTVCDVIGLDVGWEPGLCSLVGRAHMRLR